MLYNIKSIENAICYIKPLKYFTNLNKSEAALILFQLYFQKRVETKGSENNTNHTTEVGERL